MQVGRGNARPLSLVGYDDELKVILFHMKSYYCNLISLRALKYEGGDELTIHL